MAARLAKKVSRRDKILKVAADLFGEHGYRATSMRMISARARCDVALAYHYFGSKEALYETIIKDYRGRIANILVVVTKRTSPR